MADEATQAAEDIQPAAAETTAGDSATQEQTNTETQDAGNQEAAKATEDASTGEEKPSAQDVKPEHKPSSRRSAAYRIQELVRENNELKSRVAPKTESTDEWGNAVEEDKPDEKYTALEAKLAQLEGLVKPVMTNTQKAADEAELAEVFTGKPDERSKYEDSIRKMWELPQYKDLAASDLYRIATFDDAVSQAKQQAIEEYKKAGKEASEASASGSSNISNRTGGAAKSIADMSDEEFRAHNERIKAGVTGAQ